jgi:hypothetical protein
MTDHAIENAKGWLASILEMVAALEAAEASDDVTSDAIDNAQETITESVLSVLVRDGWRQPGHAQEDGPEEFEILLSTGGPALRLYGTLGCMCQPANVRLEWQDWGTPWTEYLPAREHHEALEAFASCFYFGE